VPAEDARWHATMVVRIAASDEVENDQHGVSRWDRVQFRTRSFCSAQRSRTFTPTNNIFAPPRPRQGADSRPRTEAYDQVSRIFGYLKRHNRPKMVFDDAMIDWKDKSCQADWSDSHPDAKEGPPAGTPKPRGLPVQLDCFVDAGHAGDKVTRRSHSGVLLSLNHAPITWCSKRQDTAETSTFGSESVAMKIAAGLVIAMRHKLRMTGIEVDGPCNMFCDNQSVASDSTMPESTLKKRHVSVCCHKIRESAAAGIIRVAKEKSETNLADTLTKISPAPRLRKLIGESLH